ILKGTSLFSPTISAKILSPLTSSLIALRNSSGTFSPSFSADVASHLPWNSCLSLVPLALPPCWAACPPVGALVRPTPSAASISKATAALLSLVGTMACGTPWSGREEWQRQRQGHDSCGDCRRGLPRGDCARAVC